MSATLSGTVLRTFHGPAIAEQRIYVFTMFLLKRNRTITGISPVYGAEMAKTHERARATAVTQMVGVQHSFGMPLIESYSRWLPGVSLVDSYQDVQAHADDTTEVANWTGYGAKFLTTTAQFRLGFAIQALPALALMIGVLFMPESPRWLLMKGRAAEAEASFRRLHGGWGSETWLQEEFGHIQDGVNAELAAEQDASWGEMLRRPAFRKRLFVGSFVWVAAMLSGISFGGAFQSPESLVHSADFLIS